MVVLLSAAPIVVTAYPNPSVTQPVDVSAPPNSQLTEDALVWILPEAPTQAARGEEISVVVKSIWFPGTDPVGWEYDLTYDPSLLTFVRAEPTLPAVTSQTASPCTAAFNDQGDHVATAIACGPFVAVSLAEYWFRVNNSAEGSIVVDVNNAIVIGGALNTVPSVGQSDSIDIIDIFELGLCGDHDGNGSINIGDAVSSLFYVVGSTEATSDQLFLTDVDKDGVVSVIDVIAILQHIVGLTTISDCGPPEHVRECPQGPIVASGEPLIAGAGWVQHPNNPLIYNVTVDLNDTGEVWVEYWPLGDRRPKLSTPRTAVASHHEIQIMRMKADTIYCIQVYADGVPAGPKVQTEIAPDLRGGALTTGPLPDALRTGTFANVMGDQTFPLTMLNHRPSGFSGVVTLDRDADIVWYLEGPGSPVRQKPDLNVLYANSQGNTLIEASPDGTVVSQVFDMDGDVLCEEGRWHHEMRYIGDNKAVVLGGEIRAVTFDAESAVIQTAELVFDEALEAYVSDVRGLAGTDRNQTADTVELWDIDAGTVTRQYSLFDVLGA